MAVETIYTINGVWADTNQPFKKVFVGALAEKESVIYFEQILPWLNAGAEIKRQTRERKYEQLVWQTQIAFNNGIHDCTFSTTCSNCGLTFQDEHNVSRRTVKEYVGNILYSYATGDVVQHYDEGMSDIIVSTPVKYGLKFHDGIIPLVEKCKGNIELLQSGKFVKFGPVVSCD